MSILWKYGSLAVVGLWSMAGVGQAQKQGTYEVSRPADLPRAASQDTMRFSMELRNTPRADAIRQVATKAGLALMWSRTDVPLLGTVTASWENATVRSILATILQGTNARAELSNDRQTIVIVPVKNGGAQQQTVGTVMGTVMDSASGKRLAQVAVTVNETKLAATTQENGTFRIADVPVGRKSVTARVMGYASRTVSVTVDSGKVASVVIALRPMANALSEVVTTAIGRQRRVEVGNDITRIVVDSVMNVAPVATVTDLLATRVPGLMVMPTSGLPGAPSRLRLRGTSSLSTSNDPIVIIDGIRVFADQSGEKLNTTTSLGGRGSITGARSTNFSIEGPAPIDQLDPSSIETIEVFKGPSASAMYGPDAANGVIVITTKKGQTGPVHVNAAANMGRSDMPGNWPVNYYRFGHSYRLDGVSSAGGSRLCLPFEVCETDSLVAFQALNEPRFSPLKSGMDRGVTVGVSGGSGSMTYSLLGSTMRRDGMMRLPAIEAERFRAAKGFSAPEWMRNPDQLTTYSGTSTLGLQMGRTGDASLTNTVFYSRQQQPPDLSTVIRSLANTYLDPTLATTPDELYGFTARILANSLRSTNAVTVGWRPSRWLPVTMQAGLDLYSTNGNRVLPRGYAMNIITSASDSIGSYLMERMTSSIRSLNVSTIIPVPRAQTAVGFNYSGTVANRFSAGTTGLPLGVMTPSQFVYAEGQGPTQMEASRSTFGWYVAPTFHLTSKVFFNPGFRIDGSSATGTRAGLSSLPKLDLSWLAVDRPEQAPLFGVVTQLRPRVAFGVAGVQPGVANSVRLYQPISYLPNGETITETRVSLSSIGNTKLRPERSREFEGGLDGDLWHSRVTFALSAYQKMRYDAIVAMSLAPSAGSMYIAENIGTIRNRGINASMDARLLDAGMVEWSVGGNFTRNRGMVISLIDGKEQVMVSGGERIGSVLVYRPGYPPNAVFVPRIASYADANQDGMIGASEIQIANDSVYMGASEPTDELNLRTEMSFFHGRVRLSTAISYQHGLTQYNQIGLGDINALNDPSIPISRMVEIVAGCTGVNGYCGAFDGGATSKGSAIGAYQTVNLLRWQSLSIGYHAPSSVARRLGGTTLFVSLQGSNLGLRTNYRGKDPSVNSYARGNLVSDSGQLPQPRIVQVRVTWGR